MSPILAAVLALAAAAAPKPATAAAPKPAAAAPAAQPPFSHAIHVEMLDCKECHVGMEKARSLRERHLPRTEKCQECHDDKQAPTRAVEEPHLVFPHADHLPRVEGKCTYCHKVLPEPGQTESTTPAMSTCTSCHVHQVQFAEARCQTCHVDLKRWPLRPVSVFAHQGDFLESHGAMARGSPATCATCHDQTKCAECHSPSTRPFKAEIQWPEGVLSEFIHRGDFESRHTIEASADPASCRKCHGSFFCESCHREQHVAPAVPDGLRRRPPSHQPVPQWAQGLHGIAARQNIVACAACHDQARPVCVGCHQPGGLGGNPHPPGFASRHDAGDIARNAMCRVCHQ